MAGDGLRARVVPCAPIIDHNFEKTSAKDGLVELAERMPVMSAGIPADLLVVEACVDIQYNASYACD